MKVKRDSKTVRWAYFFYETVPPRTTLCAIFWRSVLVTPFKLASASTVVGLFLYLIFMGARGAWRHPAEAIGLVVGAVFFVFLMWLTESKTGKESTTTFAARVSAYPLVQGAAAVKQRVCPLVEIER